jgi:hypothetical protein
VAGLCEWWAGEDVEGRCKLFKDYLGGIREMTSLVARIPGIPADI